MRSLFLTAAIAIPAAAFGQTEGETLINQLRGQGYAVISVQRTLLGRTLIVVSKNNETREIVINPINGEVLRNLVTSSGNGPSSAAGAGRANAHGGNSNSRAGGNAGGGGNQGGGNSGNGKGNGD